MLAPAAVHVTYCASNALPFRIDWESPNGPVMFFGLTPDAAANEAQLALAKGSVLGPARQVSLTEPVADPDWTSAMRDLIADVDTERNEGRARPMLRIVRGGAG
jgi:hypothetical protein